MLVHKIEGRAEVSSRKFQNIALMADTHAPARKAETRLRDQHDFVEPDSADVIVTLGGDGFMLSTMHAYMDQNIPIFGMNLGSVGFLMNEFSAENLISRLEAAEEISRQIKIRDLSGLIIIDFIDMLNYGNRRVVERKLKEKCRTDRARIQIGRISNFGLLEMSRQRLRESAIKWKVTLADESFAQKLLKTVELKAVINKAKFVELKVCEKISDFLKENFINDLTYFEKKNKMKIDIVSDPTLIIPEYIINIKNKSNKTIELLEQYEKLKNLKQESYKEKVIEEKEVKKFNKKPYRKKNFYKKTK